MAQIRNKRLNFVIMVIEFWLA